MTKTLLHIPNTGYSLLFEPRDLWVGVYWKHFYEANVPVLVLYICLIPMFPIVIPFYGKPVWD